LLATPIIGITLLMVIAERVLKIGSFDPSLGGDPLLYQHLFWIYSHPAVYVMILPAMGVVTEIFPTFSQKPVFGYGAIAMSSLAIALVGYFVWGHHMFTSGIGYYSRLFFSLLTFLVAIPSAIKVFNWLGTMWGGHLTFATPMLFCTAFLFQFLCAGLTGIMLAVAPFDWQLSDSYFVVAHFHYVLIGGLLFTIFAAIYYWFPKVTGKMMSETIGKWHFWLFLIGFNLTFGPLHISGILGMPRRIYTYEPGRGWDTMNFIVSIGAFIQVIAVLVFVWNLIVSYWKGTEAGNDPWDAWTLEWLVSSPPPAHNFASIPRVASRRPLWDRKHPEDPDSRYE
jgi:cytochrome c oxidase subunit 1